MKIKKRIKITMEVDPGNEVAQEYASSLADLTMNSKPLISMLTMLAEENIHHAASIVQAVEKHLQQVDAEFKLPVLYLIDSIVKNVGRAYTNLFTANLVSMFCDVFDKVDEKTRAQMFKLRHTWNETFPMKVLIAMDLRVQTMDPAWPIPTFPAMAPVSIHVNPKFLNKKSDDEQSTSKGFSEQTPAGPPSSTTPTPAVKAAASELEISRLTEARMREELLRKQKELLELQQKKIELELLQAKTRLEEQQRQMQREQDQLLLSNLQSQQMKLLAEQKAKATATASRQKVQAPQVPLPPQTLLKPRSQIPQPTSSRENIISAQRLPIPDPRKAAATSENIPLPAVFTLVADSYKAKTLAKPSIISSSTNNKDFKATKDTFLNNDPRVANKRISPVPKSMAMLASHSSRDKATSHSQDNLPKSSSSLKPKPTPPSPVRSKMPPSPLRSAPELKIEPAVSTVEVSSKTATVSEGKRDGPSSSKKGSSKSSKRPSSSGKLDSPKLDRKKNSKQSNSSDNQSKSSKDLSKSKDVRKESKKKERRRDFDSASGSKSPIKSKSDSKSGRVFKDVKGCRSRNYMRRNRSVSDSPEPPSDTAGDVDLRNAGPPDIKIPRIFKEDPDVPQVGITPPFQLEVNSKSPECSQDTKDVDLRQLTGSPLGLGKKRSPSAENSDHPSPKKSKAEMIDVLFGNEDVDLRQLGPPIAPAEVTEEAKARKKAPDWAKFKEFNPDTYRSPLKNSTWETSSEHGSQVSDIDMPTPPPPPPKLSVSPNDPRSLNRSYSRDKPVFDRLGRPLLYNRLSIDDPRERRLSTSSLSAGEDTDMRKHSLLIEGDGVDEMDSSPRNINIIIAQADEQLRNGTISFSQYNSLLKEMVHLNEVQKLKEAQRRDEQESWGDNSGSDGWERGSRSPDGSDRSRESDRSPRRDGKFKGYNDEDKDISKTEEKFGDIDERFAQSGRGEGVMPVGPNIGRGRGMPSRGLPHPSHGSMSRPWLDNCGPNGPRPHWEEPGWNQRPMGPQVPNAIPPHVRPHFRGRGDFGGPRFPRFPQPQQQQTDHFNQRFPFNSQDQSRFRYQFRSELPPADPREVDSVNQDTMKMIQIDGFPRDIRYYGHTAIIMMKWDDPRELSFQAGKRRVSFNECESVICGFGEPPQKVMLDGVIHTIQLGAPSRELYLDGKWYECYFGGPPMTIELHGKRCRVQLEGPPPQVSIGNERRTDLVAGKINLIIDACNMIPIYLDPKPQKFVIDGKPHIFRFTDAFRTVIINGRPFRPQFGGLPMPIMVHGNRHYIGFSALPPDVKVGYMKITNMEGGRLPTPPPEEEIFEQAPLQAQPSQSVVPPQVAAPLQQGHQPAMPMLGRGRKLPFDQNRSSPDPAKVGLRHPQQQQGGSKLPQRGQLDVLSSLMPGAVTAATGFSYQVQHDGQQADIKPSVPQTTGSETGVPAMLNLNLGELMQKLVSTGILPSADTAEVKKEEDKKPIKPVTLTADSLKLRQAGIFTVLYSGIQCSSCGVRFPPEQTIKYSQHLDWHFRQNRRDRDCAKKAQSRKWYYDVSDWIQFEEIEDLEERAQSWFETQEAERPEEREQEMLSVPAGENSEGVQCAMCHENFEQFYNEDKEEWHLRDAIRVDEKTYHPVCYEDFKNSMEASMDESMVQSEGQPDGETTLDEIKPVTEEGEKIKDEKDIKEEKLEDSSCAADNKDEKPEGATPGEAEALIEAQVVVKSEPIDIVIKEEPMETSEEPVPQTPQIDPLIDEDSVVNIESELLQVKIEPEESEIVMPTVVDTTLNIVTSSIDGNVELDETAPIAVPAGKIKINISKPLPPMPAPAKRVESQSDDEMSAAEQEASVAPKTSPAPVIPGDDVWDEDAPPPRPPGEDTLHLKPRLVGRKLTEIPPVFKGTEVSGLCTIM